MIKIEVTGLDKAIKDLNKIVEDLKDIDGKKLTVDIKDGETEDEAINRVVDEKLNKILG
ncbi:hypothetical protein NO1_1279 [Candidatus Termititenax aidoneus]|uniref:Uncharacterized protein n=1 Tax=Termititenax aidoneus TaxID=2218524 RepID=A0A388TBB4_TERA1|nr:hypothetical protein NO1_1279 [Candidatus Termititenax aidoneus]